MRVTLSALVIALLIHLPPTTSRSADASQILLIAEPTRESGIVTAATTAKQLETAGAVAKLKAPFKPYAQLEQADGLQPLVVQGQLTGDGGVSVSVWLPPGPGQRRVRLRFDKPPTEPPKLPVAPIAIRREGRRILVNNGFAEVTHDPAAQAGLPSRVTLLATGITYLQININDRVHDPKLGSFNLRGDPDAQVRVLREGPLEAVIEVRARYRQGAKTPDTQPAATYTFTYRAGAAAVAVEARCVQTRAFPWREHHLLELNFPTLPFPNWAGGNPAETGAFAEEPASHPAKRWGALFDGPNTIGVVSNSVTLYGGRKSGYGQYVHGPWVQWPDREQTLRCTLWLDARPDSRERLAQAAESTPPSTPAHFSTPDIERRRSDIAARIARLKNQKAAGLHRWWLTQNEALLPQGKLAETKAALEAQSALMAIAADAATIAAQIRKQNPDACILVEEKVALVLGGPAAGHAPVSFYSFEQARELLATPGRPIWEIEVEDAQRQTARWNSQTGPFKPSIQTEKNRATVTWQGAGAAKGITAKLVIVLANARCRLKLQIANDSTERSLLRVWFPQFALTPLGADSADDVFLLPTVSGALARDPLASRVQCRTEYPSGWGPLQFGAHYDPDGGVYLGAHDPFAAAKRYTVQHGGGGRVLDVALEWPAPDAGKPGNDFAPPGDVALAAFRGDWYDAAQIYRAWAAAEAHWWPARGQWGRPDTPQWLKEVCVWAQTGGSPERVVPRVKAFAEYMGVPVAFHWYRWHQIPFDNDYPHYFPARDGFAAGVAELQRAGVRVMPYINGRLWDADTSDFPTIARPAATKGRDGKPYVEHYGSQPQDLVPMCPTQAVWRDAVSSIVLRLLGPECNVDGVYIDQVAAARPRLCYDATHGHPLGGGHWWTRDGYWPMLETLNREIDRRFPEKMLTTECTAEPYAHAFDAYLTWHFQYQNAVPAVAAIYGGKLQLFGRAYKGNDQLAHRMKTAQALVFGEQLGWIDPDIITQQPVTAAHLRRCARLRQHLLAHLADGQLARPPDVRGDIPQVTADWAWQGKTPITDSALQRAAWRSRDGAVAFIFVNSTEKELRFTWHFRADRYALTGGAFTETRVTETGPEPPIPATAEFTRAITLPPLGAAARIVAKP